MVIGLVVLLMHGVSGIQRRPAAGKQVRSRARQNKDTLKRGRYTQRVIVETRIKWSNKASVNALDPETHIRHQRGAQDNGVPDSGIRILVRYDRGDAMRNSANVGRTHVERITRPPWLRSQNRAAMNASRSVDGM